MTLSFNLLVTICIAYVATLFLIAWAAERRASMGRLGILRSPLVYTLSLSIYCTAWTYYGSVGKAVSDGFTILNSRSFAENVVFLLPGEHVYNGKLNVIDGLLKNKEIILLIVVREKYALYLMY